MIKSKVFWAILSGFLLAASYPRAGFFPLAWLALVIFWILQLRVQTRSEAVSLSFFSGLTFFIISLFWLTHVIVFGWLFVAGLQAVCWLLLGLIVHEFREVRQPLVQGFAFALCWTVIEFLRAEFPIFGLGWNLLAYSQASFLSLIQIADVCGAYGLGFLMALLSSFLAIVINDFLKTRKFELFKVLKVFVPSLLVFSMVVGYGIHNMSRKDPGAGGVRIAVLQGNVPQDIKWIPESRETIFDIYIKLSQLANFDRPLMIVWPEASFPGYLNRDPNATVLMDWARELGVSFLIGSPYMEDSERVYNSAFFINDAGDLKNRYDKIELVPFGEYIPLEFIFGALKPLAQSLGVSDFIAGEELKIFQLTPAHRFGVLICFEDTFPRLAREYVENGASFLTVITNDAWFGVTGAAHQHLQASIFRAVENGVPIARSANTGVSGFVSRFGEVTGMVAKDGNPLFVTGHKTMSISMDQKKTIYTTVGWIFPYVACLLFGLTWILFKFKKI